MQEQILNGISHLTDCAVTSFLENIVNPGPLTEEKVLDKAAIVQHSLYRVSQKTYFIPGHRMTSQGRYRLPQPPSLELQGVQNRTAPASQQGEQDIVPIRI